MKRLRNIPAIPLILLLAFFACEELPTDKGEHYNPMDPENPANFGNNPPVVPYNPSPADSVTNIAVTTSLSWSCSDPDGDTLIFEVSLGLVNPPPVVTNDCLDSFWTPDTLEYDTTYFWKIEARDNHGHLVEGPVWTFSTSHSGN